MNESTFEHLIQQSEKLKNIQLEAQGQPSQLYELKPKYAQSFESLINEGKPMGTGGYYLKQQRVPTQILYKPALKKQDPESFLVYQQKNLLDTHKQLNLVKSKMSQNQLHCFMTLEQLRRHPLSKYFMALPDPLYLELYDFGQAIEQPLDIRTIANKLLRRKYKDLSEFEADMVTMIHNYRTYFVHQKQLFDVSIKFEMLFWDYYNNQKNANTEAIQKFKYYKSRCTSTITRPKKIKSQFTLQRKKKLAKIFNIQSRELKKQIVSELQRGTMKNEVKNFTGGLDIGKFRDEFFQQLQMILQRKGVQIEKSLSKEKKIQKTQNMQKRQKRQQKQKRGSSEKNKNSKKKASKKEKKQLESRMQEEDSEIYYGDSEEEEVAPQKFEEQKKSREEIKEILNMINDEVFFDSEDD